MRAVLKALHSPDVVSLESWSSEGRPFGFLLQAMIGPAGQDGSESFDLVVCTPEWFAAHRLQSSSVAMGTHTLFVSHYDIGAIKAFIEASIQKCTGENWHEIAEQLSRFGRWEFEGYRPA